MQAALWILLIVAHTGHGATTTPIAKFTNKPACESAAQKIEDQFVDRMGNSTVIAKCVEMRGAL